MTQHEADELLAAATRSGKGTSLARRRDFVPHVGTLESMWHGYMGRDECFVEDVETGVPRAAAKYLQHLAACPRVSICTEAER